MSYVSALRVAEILCKKDKKTKDRKTAALLLVQG
jgi:hypothetical protein